MTEERRLQLREALQRIEDREGRLTANLVVREARKQPNSPLGQCFEWNKDKAAQQYWLQQARDLIRSVTITVEVQEKSVQVNCYVRDPERDGDEQGYRSILKIREEPEPSRMLLLAEFSQAEAHLERANVIALVVGNKKETAKALHTLQRMRVKVENAVQPT